MPIGARAGLKPADQLRNYAGQGMLEAAQLNPKVVVLDGDLGNSTGAHEVKKAFPERFFNIGIAEANMVGIGAGLASCGYVPILTSLGSFLWYNAYDQARLSVALAGLNVKFLGSHSGFSTGREGPSSMGTEDIVLASALPPMTVLVPCDPVSMRKLVVAACAYFGPVYIRSSREPLPRVYAEDAQFEIGRANVVRQGTDVTLIGCGLTVPVALDAAAILAEEGIQARVLDMHTVKPLDVAAITAAARETGAIVTGEEQVRTGGVGSNIARVVTETCPVPMRVLAIPDVFPDTASPAEIMQDCGLTAEDMVRAARELVALQRSA
jgi:transketolase